ncbi:MAG: tetratricopeptide repeat protein [Chthonomonadales bacterium]|nr:tetratricopeptide repeat protein [Chthonomonadales bacterium]
MDERFQSCLVLGVGLDVTREELRRRYRELAREWHPDRAAGHEQGRREAERRLRAINRAYEVLEAGLTDPWGEGSGSLPAESGHDVAAWTRGLAERSHGGGEIEAARSLRERALRLYMEGIVHFGEHRWREAISALTRSVYLVQANPEAYLALGRAYRRVNLPAKAEAAYREAARLSPDHAEARYELGETHVALGDLDAAEADARRLDGPFPELAALIRASAEHARARSRAPLFLLSDNVHILLSDNVRGWLV